MSASGAELAVRKCGCGAEIVWARSVNGRPVPLDWPPEVRGALSRNGQVVHMVDTYMPHHATCPDVDRYRQPGPGPAEQPEIGL